MNVYVDPCLVSNLRFSLTTSDKDTENWSGNVTSPFPRMLHSSLAHCQRATIRPWKVYFHSGSTTGLWWFGICSSFCWSCSVCAPSPNIQILPNAVFQDLRTSRSGTFALCFCCFWSCIKHQLKLSAVFAPVLPSFPKVWVSLKMF